MPFSHAESRRARQDFPALSRPTGDPPLAYLDGPAGTQVPRSVLDAMNDYYEQANANTHGRFATSRESDRRMLEVRRKVAAFLGVDSWRRISFGQNMTTLAYSLSRALAREIRPGDEVVITQLDHEANRGPWAALGERGARIREVALTPEGVLDRDDLEAKIGARTRLVAIGWASNALGTVNDVEHARRLASAVGAQLVVDAVHYAPHFPIDGERLDADFLLCSAYKFYGPHVGILCARDGLLDQLEPERLSTQDQEAPYRIETGTLNHAALAGVGAAIDYLASWGEGDDLRSRSVDAMSSIAQWEHSLARRYEAGLRELPGVRIWGPPVARTERRAPTVSITVEGVDSGDVAERLGESGLQVWDGHFYAARAVEVLGLADRGGLVRTGFSLYNDPDEVDRLVAALREIAASAR